MRRLTINELPESDELPADGEVLLPVFLEEGQPIRRITFKNLILAIKKHLEKEGSIVIAEDEKGRITFSNTK